MISKAKRGWVTGIIEGEGCITIGKSIRSENKKLRYNFQIKLDNTNPLIPLEFYKLFEGCLYEVKPSGLGSRRVYRWCITGVKKVIPFIKLIRPYMVSKTEQADIILKNKKIFASRSFKNRKEITKAQHSAYEAMRIANHKIILSETFEKRNVQRLNGNPSNNEVKIKSELQENLQSQSEVIDRPINRVFKVTDCY